MWYVDYCDLETDGFNLLLILLLHGISSCNFIFYVVYWFRSCHDGKLFSILMLGLLQVKQKTLIIWGEDDQIIDNKLAVVCFFQTLDH